MLSVEDLTVKYGSFTALDAISFDVDEGQWLMVAGPNGAGKSTIVSAVSQGVPYGGQIRFNGTDLSRMRSKLIARHIAILTQNHSVGYSFTVKEITMLGRYAYREAMSGFTKADEEAVQRALEQTGMAEYANKSVLALSGGELQRVFLAQVFAQDPKLLILDEPANHLDLIYQNRYSESSKNGCAKRAELSYRWCMNCRSPRLTVRTHCLWIKGESFPMERSITY